MLNIIIFGPPGAGKGTQSERLIAEFGLKHISTGDLLRAQRAAKTKLGLEADNYISKGELVPDEVVIGMVNDFILNNTATNGFIFDGFPRTAPQAVALNTLLSSYNSHIAIVLGLEVVENELVNRLLLRGKVSGRVDDQNEEVIRSRFNEYNLKTQPLIDFYKLENKYKAINGMGNMDDIFTDLCTAIKDINGSAGI